MSALRWSAPASTGWDPQNDRDLALLKSESKLSRLNYLLGGAESPFESAGTV